MIVYRRCSKKEITYILETRNYMDVGAFYSTESSKVMNTHNYLKNKRYLHFFGNQADLFFFDLCEDYYICTYDIPNVILNKYRGIGYYYDRINFRNLEEIEEYAIINDDMKFDYLLKVQQIQDEIDIEDFLYGNIDVKLLTIYVKENDKIKSKKTV